MQFRDEVPRLREETVDDLAMHIRDTVSAALKLQGKVAGKRGSGGKTDSHSVLASTHMEDQEYD